jgi:MFS family permease
MSRKLGPIYLAEGVLPRHVYSYLFAAFMSIGLFSYLTAMTPYLLRVNLGLDEGSHGSVSGILQFWQEIVVIAVISWWGALSDRFGRRIIYIIGFVIMGLGYALYAFAQSVPELVAYRLIFAVGIAATNVLLSTMLADYADERSRGKLTGAAFFLNGMGSIVFFMGLTKLPAIYADYNIDELWAGRYTYLTIAVFCFFTAAVMLGLKPGKPDKVAAKVPVARLVAEGLKAARQPRIFVCYLSSIAARADMIIITIYMMLWLQMAAVDAGMTSAEAVAKAGMTVGIAQFISVVWTPVFGILADKIDRLSLLIIAFALASAGYGWVALQDDILASAAIPAIVLMCIGQMSTILAATVLLGQEAPQHIRGSVFGMQAFFCALGILALSLCGGYLYDNIGPAAPFWAITLVNGIVLLAAVLVRRREQRRQAVH